MKMIPGYVMLMLMCLLGAFSVGEGVLTTRSCLTFNHTFTLKVEEFMGKWYEVRRLHDPLDPEQEDCVVMNYQLLENGTFEIQKSFQITKTGLPSYVSDTVKLRANHESRIPQFYEILNSTNTTASGILFNIVTTDYKNFAILYSCTPINSTHNHEAAWVLSRLPALENKEDKMVNLWWASDIKRPNDWRATAQSSEFCKPSNPDDLQMTCTTVDSVETTSESISSSTDANLNGATQDHLSDDSYSVTFKIIFWVGLLAGGMLLLFGIWFIVSRST